jgi:hypothetical protein
MTLRAPRGLRIQFGLVLAAKPPHLEGIAVCLDGPRRRIAILKESEVQPIQQDGIAACPPEINGSGRGIHVDPGVGFSECDRL